MSNQEFKEAAIGTIPKDWEVIDLNQDSYLKIIMGQSPPSSTYNYCKNGLPFLQGKAEFGSRFPNPVLYCSKPIKIVEKDSILLSVRAPVGDVNIACYKMCIGRGLLAVETNNKKLNNIFLFYYLNYIKKHINSFSSGSTFKSITKNDLKKIEIPVPNLTEQEKIAEILSAVDQVIEEVGESINKTEQLKKGLMQELLTRGIGHEEFKETEIGRIPKEWKVIKLENLLCLEYGDGLTDRERRGSEYPVYGSNGIIGYNSKYLVEGPGIIVGRKGTIGAIKWSEVNFWPIDTTYYVKLKELRINLRWLFYKLSTLSLSKLNMATGTPGLNRDLVYKLKISVPLFQEQERIVEILLTIDKRIQFLKEKKNKLEKVKKGLMSELLTGRKRVKA